MVKKYLKISIVVRICLWEEDRCHLSLHNHANFIPWVNQSTYVWSQLDIVTGKWPVRIRRENKNRFCSLLKYSYIHFGNSKCLCRTFGEFAAYFQVMASDFLLGLIRYRSIHLRFPCPENIISLVWNRIFHIGYSPSGKDIHSQKFELS